MHWMCWMISDLNFSQTTRLLLRRAIYSVSTVISMIASRVSVVSPVGMVTTKGILHRLPDQETLTIQMRLNFLVKHFFSVPASSTSSWNVFSGRFYVFWLTACRWWLWLKPWWREGPDGTVGDVCCSFTGLCWPCKHEFCFKSTSPAQRSSFNQPGSPWHSRKKSYQC